MLTKIVHHFGFQSSNHIELKVDIGQLLDLYINYCTFSIFLERNIVPHSLAYTCPSEDVGNFPLLDLSPLSQFV
jgi:hypothetical protein